MATQPLSGTPASNIRRRTLMPMLPPYLRQRGQNNRMVAGAMAPNSIARPLDQPLVSPVSSQGQSPASQGYNLAPSVSSNPGTLYSSVPGPNDLAKQAIFARMLKSQGYNLAPSVSSNPGTLYSSVPGPNDLAKQAIFARMLKSQGYNLAPSVSSNPGTLYPPVPDPNVVPVRQAPVTSPSTMIPGGFTGGIPTLNPVQQNAVPPVLPTARRRVGAGYRPL